MESKVIFRDYQEQQAQDHNDLQSFTERSFDHLTLDAVSNNMRLFAGFGVTKTGQVEVQVQPGRFYDVLGVIYALNTTTVQSMVSYLAAAFSRYMLLTATGSDVETDIEERDYLVDVTTGATEPRAVATTRSRAAVLAWTTGTESGDPQRPAVPVGHVAIAYIKVDTTQVVSIEMIEKNRVASTSELDLRSDLLQDFADMIGPKVAALAADLADLRRRLDQLGAMTGLATVAMDLSRVKATLRYPTIASDYDTDWFLDNEDSDDKNLLQFGYDCRLEEGARFPYANMDEFEITLFSGNDPNAALHASGLLLPKYVEIFRFGTTQGGPDTTLGIAQYGYQTTEMRQGFMSRSRMRYGGNYIVCANASTWNNNNLTEKYADLQNAGAGHRYDPTSILYPDGSVSTQLTMATASMYNSATLAYEITRYDQWWYDTWLEPYMYAVTVDHTLNGALVAQSLSTPNDIWATSVWIYISAKAAAEDINMTIMEMIAGVPDTNKVICKVAYPQASIIVGWNKIAIPPTFLRKGTKYAYVFISNANHTIGMVSGQKYLDGTFYYSTDGIYYQGDLTKDMMIQVWGAYFNNSQVTIEFAPINLDGGFRDVDICAEMWVPSSCNIYWEMRPNGTGEWQPLIKDNADVLAQAPPLAQFRARFDGSRDMHGGIKLTGSRVAVWRPKTHFVHVSKPLTLASACTTIKVTMALEWFDEVPHDFAFTMRTGNTLSVIELPDATTTKVTDAVAKRYSREYVFNVAPAVTKICFIGIGDTNTPQNTFHLGERTYYSTT
jgi:hypothetical protein